MRIWLPARRNERASARQWFVGLSIPFRRHLDDAIKALECDLGPCNAYVEVAIRLPRGFQQVRHNQIDLLLCFQHSVAVCEIKGHRRLTDESVDKAVAQANAYLDLARVHAGAQDGIHPFLFFPQLDQNALTSVADRLADGAQHHVRAVGALAALAGTRTARRHALYLPEALAQLKDRPRLGRATPGTAGIRAAVEHASGKLSDFDSMLKLGEFLASIGPSPITQLNWHLADLRRDECARATEILTRHGVVEIVGAPGIGKSSLAGDVVERWLSEHPGCDHERVRLSDCADSLAIRSSLVAQVDAYAPDASDVDGAFRLLLERPRVVWIEQRDKVPDAALREFLLEISDTRRTSHVRWIVESRIAVLTVDRRIELSGLSRADLNRVLDGVPGEAPPSMREWILGASRGNPRTAILLWRSESPDQNVEPREDTLAWFLGRTSRDERAVLEAMAHLVSISPLGLPIEALQTWVVKVLPTLPPTDARKALGSALAKLQAAQLAHVERVAPLAFGSLVAGDGGLATEIGDLLFWMDDDLIAKLSLGSDTTSLRDEAEEHLYDTASGEDAIAVTLALNLNEPDIGPFLRSTFRRTHLPQVMAWLERRGVVGKIALRKEQAAVYRCLVLLRRTFSGARPTKEELDECVASMPDGSDVARVAATVVEGLLLGLDRTASPGAVELWKQRCAAEPIRDLRCEMEVRLAAALAGRDNHVEAWQVLQGCMATSGVSDGARALVLTYALGELNRLKIQVDGFPEGPERRHLIEDLSRELFALGVRVGNYTVCGDAVFYFVRAAEYDRASAKDFGEDAANQLLSMLPALEVVERVSGTRRTQALLTQGSIHRHVGRWQDVGQDRFLSHAMAAIRLYQRVLHGALPRGHLTFALNAASYMIDVCIKLLRFDADSTSASVILAHARSASDGAAKVIAALRPEAMVQRDSEIEAEIARTLPILEYVIAVHDREPAGATNALVATVTSMRNVVEDHGKPRRARAQQLGALLRNVNRAVRFANRTGLANHRTALAQVQPPWRWRLQETFAFVARIRDRKLQRALEQLLALLEAPDPV